jgi:hypothetical protein
MKLFSKFLVLFLISLSFQCSKNNAESNDITREMLDQKKSIIQDYINSFDCSQSTECLSMAFGAKPCGGPWEYIVFPNSIDIDVLTQMVNEYNEMEHEFNVKTGAVSDCMFVGPPTQIDCTNGQCSIIN